jgi:predicted Zn-dependent protease
VRKTAALTLASRALVVAALAAGGPAWAQSTPGAAPPLRLPSLGEASSEALPVATERRYGEQIMLQLRRDPAWLDDPVLLDYVQSLWQPLLAAARRRGDIEPDVDNAFAWDIFLLRERTLNAFALPGGRVGVHLGLIAATASSDELASVLAHELAHLSQRHIARGIASASRQSGVATVAMVLGALLAARAGSPDLAQAAIAGGQASLIQGQLNFSRDMEREADRIGHGVHVEAGFDAAGSVAMFDRLDQSARLNDAGSLPYLRTHPLTTERLAEARTRLPAQGTPGPLSTPEHTLMQARARALAASGADALRRLVEAAAVGSRNDAGGLYAGALAASKLGDHGRAQTLAQALASTVGTPSSDSTTASQGPARCSLPVTLLRAELALARGNPSAAQGLLETCAPAPPTRAALLLRAQADAVSLTQAREGKRESTAQALALRASVQDLQTWLASHPQDAAAWGVLARGADALGLTLRALRAQAEERAALGDLDAAIDRLRGAQQVARQRGREDFIEASVIDARLRQFEAQRRQRAADMR